MKFAKEISKDINYFDGEEFFNPWMEKGQKGGLFTFLRMRFSSPWAKWPDRVEVPKVKPEARIEKGVRITFVNHSSFLIQLPGLNILTDPVWSERVSPFTWIGPKRVHEPGVAFEDLPPIDVVLLSHNHYDHLDVATLQKIAQKHPAVFLAGLGNELFLKENGVEKAHELAWWQSRALKEHQIHFVPAQHFSGRWLDDRNTTLWGGFVLITPQGQKIYFGGDTGYGPFVKEIHQKFGAMDLALIPIGAYEPRWFMRSMHNNPDDAVLTHIDLQARQSVGIHFGCFQLTAEEIEAPVEDLKIALAKYKVSANQFLAPKAGNVYSFWE